ncbi:uncharacterized protein LOC143486822 isoform X1 [Brachyhypopomus gauderio]|uniref:uncharacterized protein LOC143486822 isoform X1 n=2 Tax=Brachyhypopomus gauderio TaxID=698409 RepID=UPI00404376F4
MSKSSLLIEEGGGVTAVITPPASVSEHPPVSAPPPSSLQSPQDTPPSPPPLPVDGGSPMHSKRRVRSFYWKPIPKERVQQCGAPNLWTLHTAAGKQMFHIDIKNLEDLFAHHDDRQVHRTNGMKTSWACRTLQEPKTEILDSKRSMTLAIFLKRFKKSHKSIIEDILHGNSAAFGSEALRDLLKLLPESAEVEMLHAYRGDPGQLCTVDSFMYHLTLIPSFDLRIEALLLKEEFSPLCSSLKQNICTVRYAARELLSCVELHCVLHLVLEAGNILNSGGYGGNAAGFKLSSLLSLADTKANKPGMNLLHFVAMEAKKKDEWLLKFPERLQHVERAARVSVEDLTVEWECLSMRTKRVEQNTQAHPELQDQLHMFLQNSGAALEDINRIRTELQKDEDDLIDFFCEDKDTFRLDDCFHIFQHFCSKFTKAVQENVERECREESQMKRARGLEQKRRSWADGDMVPGVFGSKCSTETDVQAALKEKELVQLFKPHPQSLQSPFTFGRFSLRCSWQQPSEVSPNSADTHSPTHRWTDSKSELQSSAAAHTHTSSGQMDEHVEAHTQMPALEDHGNGSLQKSSPEDITGTSFKMNNKVDHQCGKWMAESRNSRLTSLLGTQEKSSNTMQTGPKAHMGERSICLKHSENERENSTATNHSNELSACVPEVNTSSAASHNDTSDVKTIKDSSESNKQTSKPNNHVSVCSIKESRSHIETHFIMGEKKTDVCRSPRKTPTKLHRKIFTSPVLFSSPSHKTSHKPPVNPKLPLFVNPSSSSPSPEPPLFPPVRILTPSEGENRRRAISLARIPQTASRAVHMYSEASKCPNHTGPALSPQRSSTLPSPSPQRSSTHPAPSPPQTSSTHPAPSPPQTSSTHPAPSPPQTSSTHPAPSPPQTSSTHPAPSPPQTSSTHPAPSPQTSSTHPAPSPQRSSTHPAPSPPQRSSTHPAPSPPQRSSTHPAPSPPQTSSTHPAPSPPQTSSTHPAPSPPQTSSTHPAPSPPQTSSTHLLPPMQSSSLRKSVIQHKSVTEKMCRFTVRALAQPGGKSSGLTSLNSFRNDAPSFARNTVASTTRRAVASSNLSVSHSTRANTPKVPPLNRTASLRLSQSRMNPQSMHGSNINPNPNPGKAGKEKSAIAQVSWEKPFKPVWK